MTPEELRRVLSQLGKGQQRRPQIASDGNSGATYGGINGLMAILQKLDPESAQRFLAAQQTAALHDGTPGSSSAGDRARGFQRAFSTPKGGYADRTKSAQVGALEEQLEALQRQNQAPAKASGFGRASTPKGFGSPYGNDMIFAGARERAGERAREDRAFETKSRDLELQTLKEALERAREKEKLERERFELDKLLSTNQDGRIQGRHNMKRRSLLEMFT